MSNIFLIGFMGTGKSSVSKELSLLTKYREIDLDGYIVEQENRSINDIFANEGEEVFRKIETKYLKKVSLDNDLIISCGGGVILKEENISIMKERGVVVLLEAKPETIYNRVKNSTNRPLLKDNMSVEYIRELKNKREAYYLKARDIVVDTDDKTCDEISREILEKIKKNS